MLYSWDKSILFINVVLFFVSATVLCFIKPILNDANSFLSDKGRSVSRVGNFYKLGERVFFLCNHFLSGFLGEHCGISSAHDKHRDSNHVPQRPECDIGIGFECLRDLGIVVELECWRFPGSRSGNFLDAVPGEFIPEFLGGNAKGSKDGFEVLFGSVESFKRLVQSAIALNALKTFFGDERTNVVKNESLDWGVDGTGEEHSNYPSHGGSNEINLSILAVLCEGQMSEQSCHMVRIIEIIVVFKIGQHVV